MDIDDLLKMIEHNVNKASDFVPMASHPVTGERGTLGKFLNFGKRLYVLFGGSGGTGKTSIVDYLFVISLYRQYLRGEGPKPFWIYRSMERNSTWKLAKWTALLLYLDHGLLIDTATLLGMPTKTRDLSPADFKLIESYREFFQDFRRHMVLLDGAVEVGKAKEQATEIMYQKGLLMELNDGILLINGEVAEVAKEFYREDTTSGIRRPYVYLEGRGVSVYEGQPVFIPANPDELVIYLTDHIGKYKKGDRSDNSVIDEHADFVGEFRDVYGAGIVDISQFNREVHDSYRKASGTIIINERDFRGCSKPYHNCDMALGMMDPEGLGLFQHEGYDLPAFKSPAGHCRFRDLRIVKNNWGPDKISFALAFIGENGYIHELPPSPDDITEEFMEKVRLGEKLF